jgi:D-3-phosphoglycerate dehydrogenase
MRRIGVITPVSHLRGIDKLLKTKGSVFYGENFNKNEVRDLITSNNLDTLVCNPNKQSYIIDAELLSNTKIKTINTCSTGLNHIDLDYCGDKNIEIQCHKNDSELIDQLPSTSELAFGLMLSLLRKIPACNSHVEKGGWDYTKFMGRQIKDLNIGIVGYGRLGKMMYNFCEAFNAKVKIFDPYVKNELSDSFLLNHWCNSLEDLFKFSDVISLHVHVNDETKYMINEKILGLAKKDSYIINTSRGEIVNESDIVNALKRGNLSGYGTDVLENEFNNKINSPIIDAMREGENIVITPHVGGMTLEGQTKAYKWSINKL